MDGELKTTVAATQATTAMVTEGEVKTLKGIWVFNDVLSAPSAELEQEIEFSLSTIYGTASATGFDVNLSDSDVEVIFLGTSIGDVIAYEYEENGWRTDYGDDIQTITFTSEQEVSDVFYEWFVANATEVVEDATLENINFDLSTLNLSTGTHTITVKATADGYADSDFSNAVEYEVTSSVKTLSGTWVFNDELSMPSGNLKQEIGFLVYENYSYIGDTNDLSTVTIVITDEPKEYFAISYSTSDNILRYAEMQNEAPVYGITYNFNSPNWDEMYDYAVSLGVSTEGASALKGLMQTITFTTEQEVSDEFYAWFVANATKTN